ncbi:hypothetical protein Nepgr_014703 [Nepenthes gracilis]|uniref:Uncharacterized protein n=1 Tax=Nepenthes gracilis TaxID=150966 RepID=A0AAD3SKI5_NEPGR|nr:hypothetical protein Nepgr_014703 [Nepenthes gracilis]
MEAAEVLIGYTVLLAEMKGDGIALMKAINTECRPYASLKTGLFCIWFVVEWCISILWDSMAGLLTSRFCFWFDYCWDSASRSWLGPCYTLTLIVELLMCSLFEDDAGRQLLFLDAGCCALARTCEWRGGLAVDGSSGSLREHVNGAIFGWVLLMGPCGSAVVRIFAVVFLLLTSGRPLLMVRVATRFCFCCWFCFSTCPGLLSCNAAFALLSSCLLSGPLFLLESNGVPMVIQWVAWRLELLLGLFSGSEACDF